MHKPLILFCQWFGPWPEWIELFVESCKWKRDIDWLIFTDQTPPQNEAPNIRSERVGFQEHKAMIAEAIALDLSQSHGKPAYAALEPDV